MSFLQLFHRRYAEPYTETALAAMAVCGCSAFLDGYLMVQCECGDCRLMALSAQWPSRRHVSADSACIRISHSCLCGVGVCAVPAVFVHHDGLQSQPSLGPSKGEQHSSCCHLVSQLMVLLSFRGLAWSASNGRWSTGGTRIPPLSRLSQGESSSACKRWLSMSIGLRSPSSCGVLLQFAEADRDRVVIIFSAHSLPMRVIARYESCQLVLARACGEASILGMVVFAMQRRSVCARGGSNRAGRDARAAEPAQRYAPCSVSYSFIILRVANRSGRRGRASASVPACVAVASRPAAVVGSRTIPHNCLLAS